MKLNKIFLASISILLTSIACGSGPVPDFNWNPEIWAGDSRTASIVRKNGEVIEVIPTNHSDFDEMICMHKSEPRKAVYNYNQNVRKCKAWEN